MWESLWIIRVFRYVCTNVCVNVWYNVCMNERVEGLGSIMFHSHYVKMIAILILYDKLLTLKHYPINVLCMRNLKNKMKKKKLKKMNKTHQIQKAWTAKLYTYWQTDWLTVPMLCWERNVSIKIFLTKLILFQNLTTG